jgi:hypothetical protein
MNGDEDPGDEGSEIVLKEDEQQTEQEHRRNMIAKTAIGIANDRSSSFATRLRAIVTLIVRILVGFKNLLSSPDTPGYKFWANILGLFGVAVVTLGITVIAIAPEASFFQPNFGVPATLKWIGMWAPIKILINAGFVALTGLLLLAAVGIGIIVADDRISRSAIGLTRFYTTNSDDDSPVRLETSTGHDDSQFSQEIQSILPADHTSNKIDPRPLVGSPDTDAVLTYDPDNDGVLLMGRLHACTTGEYELDSEIDLEEGRLLNTELIEKLNQLETVDIAVESRITRVSTFNFPWSSTRENEVVNFSPFVVCVGPRGLASDAIQAVMRTYKNHLEEQLPNDVVITTEMTSLDTIPSTLNSCETPLCSPGRKLTPGSSKEPIKLDSSRLAMVIPVVDDTTRPDGLTSQPRTQTGRQTRPENLDGYRESARSSETNEEEETDPDDGDP